MLRASAMSTRPLKLATCTPVAFHANSYFYTRDTGLICRELRALGHECRVIMPLPAHEDDLQVVELQRVPRSLLSSTDWWKAQGLDAVMLYSWGDPRYTGIARAIRKAGIRLMIHFDSSGELHEHLMRPGNKVINRAKDILINLVRSRHLSYADDITTSLPCMEKLRSDSYYGCRIADKCREFPTPVNSCFRYDGSGKEARIICTGNWENPVKRVSLLTQTLECVLARHPVVRVDICGPLTPAIQTWQKTLPPASRERVLLHGFCTHEQLCRLYQRACISLCTSESEGSHAASAEALCCGCSVVCPPRPLLSVVGWYTSRNSGTVSREDTPGHLCQALLEELEKWQAGTRNAAEIATAWQPCFQVSQLAGWMRSQPQ